MKIKEEDFPQIPYIKGLKSILGFDQDCSPTERDNFSTMFNDVKSKVQNFTYVTDPFMDAAFKARNSIMTEEFADEIVNESGTILYAATLNGKRRELTISYLIKDKFSYVAFVLGSYQGRPILISYDFCNDNKAHSYCSSIGSNDPRAAIYIVFNILLFKKYAKTEVIHTRPGERNFIDSVNYKNLTKSDITFLDSKWFREIVNSNEFTVSGHFRLQPYKDGHKELIYINEFKKHGYHRKAKIDNQEND